MKKRVGFVSNSSSSSFIVHQPKNLSRDDFESRVLNRYSDVLSEEIKDRIFNEYNRNNSSILKLMESLLYQWSYESNSTNSFYMSSAGLMPSGPFASFKISEVERFFNIKIDLEKVKEFDNLDWGKTEKAISEYAIELLSKVKEKDFSCLHFSDDVDSYLEHELMPQLEVIEISHH